MCCACVCILATLSDSNARGHQKLSNIEYVIVSYGGFVVWLYYIMIFIVSVVVLYFIMMFSVLSYTCHMYVYGLVKHHSE